jgi:hypothetical protein
LKKQFHAYVSSNTQVADLVSERQGTFTRNGQIPMAAGSVSIKGKYSIDDLDLRQQWGFSRFHVR